MLSMLVCAQTEDGSPLSPRQIHDEALTLLLAGHETTALALSWTWYLLAQHPDVDAAMQTEFQTVLGAAADRRGSAALAVYPDGLVGSTPALSPGVVDDTAGAKRW